MLSFSENFTEELNQRLKPDWSSALAHLYTRDEVVLRDKVKFRWSSGASNQSEYLSGEWFLHYEGTRGLLGRERSVELQVFDLHYI